MKHLRKHLIVILSLLPLLPAESSGQSQLNIHGFFSQAYAVSDGNQIFGISDKGTSDYRNLALQFRFQVTTDNNIVIQLNHKRIGLSPLRDLEEEVELDWGFFEHTFNEAFSLQVGKILLPLGIYNQTRDVGVLLPFYAVPFTPYGEGSYTSETVDGLSLTYSRDFGADWVIDSEVYFGQWEWSEWYIQPNIFGDGSVVLAEKATLSNAAGLWLWINTPRDGLRIGTGGFWGKVSDGILFEEGQILGPQNIRLLNIALDFTFNRGFLRSEINSYSLRASKLWSYGQYVQAGYQLTKSFSLIIQGEGTRVYNTPVTTNSPPIARIDYNRDLAIGLKFSRSSHLALKLEGHLNRGFIAEEPLFSIDSEPFKTAYTIISLSTSF